MKKKYLMLLPLTLAFVTARLIIAADSDAVNRVGESAKVLSEIMSAPDQNIPSDLMANAHCIVIIPGMKKAGFIVGGQYGKGVVSCHAPGGYGWTGPSTIRVEGGSVGFQIGGAETDVILLVMDEDGANKLMESKFTLGADATVAAGPVGRAADAQTDAEMHAKILAYSRSRGVFAGIALDAGTLRPDNDDNQTIYGRKVEHKDILTGKVTAPPSAAALIATLNKYSTHEKKS